MSSLTENCLLHFGHLNAIGIEDSPAGAFDLAQWLGKIAHRPTPRKAASGRPARKILPPLGLPSAGYRRRSALPLVLPQGRLAPAPVFGRPHAAKTHKDARKVVAVRKSGLLRDLLDRRRGEMQKHARLLDALA